MEKTQKKIDLNKCRMACDLFLGAMSNDEHLEIKLDYYRELCDLVKEYGKLVEENEQLSHENFGLKQTNSNLKADIQKTYGRLGWDNGYGKRHRVHGKRRR